MLHFSNRFTELPADPIEGSERRAIRNACYSRVKPKPMAKPQLMAWSREVADLLELETGTREDPEFIDVLTGNRLLPGMDPHATCYGGHQFGNWAGQLGDGRAINLGEVQTSGGDHFMLQLKGAGPTPYSRTADGFAVLRSSVREFLCSEAMHHLGVPTTRALSLTTTGEDVVRDMLYDGHPAAEPGAVVCRVAPSFTRFGHFEILAARGETDLLRQFTEFCIRTDFPELLPSPDAAITKEVLLTWFEQVCERTALMVAHWMRVGFVHGVMNTDNLSILGLTIDYGPYGWLEDYDPDWTPNTTDAGQRRYRYGQQPAIAQWNLLQLANAIYPLIGEAPDLERLLTGYGDQFGAHWQAQRAAKLGFAQWQPATDDALWEQLVTILDARETDMTRFFRALADLEFNDTGDGLRTRTGAADPRRAFDGAYYDQPTGAEEQQQALQTWLAYYYQRLQQDSLSATERHQRLCGANPKYVLRNYLAQLAIDQAETGDASGIAELLEVMRSPYAEQPEYERYAALRPDWARTRVGCSQLSCSS